jgi:4-hydroxy-tetrahydrodipicolinate reductase
MNILLHGCNGRMGQVITRLVSEDPDISITCGVDSAIEKFVNPYPVYEALAYACEKIDVIIDFSNHSCINSLLQYGINNKVGLVLCTTGFTTEEKESILKASKEIPIFSSGNMSIGVNLIMSLAKLAAAKLYGAFDMEIIEKHHNQKLDAPSGTALMIADAINSSLDNKMEYSFERQSKHEKRQKNEIGIHSIRGGAIIGEHEVIFAGAGEVIELKHSAISRDVFGVGAVQAAKFLHQKPPGLYNMENLIET